MSNQQADARPEAEQEIAVFLTDDHPPFRIGMRTLLQQDALIRVVGEADTGQQTLQQLAQLQPHVLVLDCQLPDLDGPAIATAARQQVETVRILALSAYDDLAYIRGMLAAGAQGYVLKNEAPAVIIAAVKATAQGRSYFSASVAQHLTHLARGDGGLFVHLTEREQEVLRLLADGLTNTAIAQKLDVAERTIAYHVENLMGKLNTSNRTETVVTAIKLGWLRV